MNESTFWDLIKRKTQSMPIIWQRIESGGTSLGVPDLAYSCEGMHGWVELKYIHDWPKKELTKVRIPHLTSLQKYWIKKHGELGGSVYLFLRVGRSDFLLFDHEAMDKIGDLNKEELYVTAISSWSLHNLSWEEVCRTLQSQGKWKVDLHKPAKKSL